MVYVLIFYLMCAYFLVILPLPESRTAVVAYAAHPQLTPFNSLGVLIQSSGLTWQDPSTWLNVFTDLNFYEIVFNVLLLVPLGMFLRYYFKCTWWKCLIIGFATSLFFEISQLSGLFGIYLHPYRIFDVDDLITNTSGAMIGFLIMGPALKWLPSMSILNQSAREQGVRTSLVRRGMAFAIDMIFVEIASVALSILLIALGGASLFGDGASLTLVTQIIGGLLFFVVVPIMTKGQTIGQKILKLVIVRPDGSPAPWDRLLARYGTLFFMLILPVLLVDLLLELDVSGSGELSSVARFMQAAQPIPFLLVAAFFAVWLISLLVRSLHAKKQGNMFVMLNEHISGTRIMTKDKLSLLRDRMVILSVPEVAKLEHAIAEKGISLAELMKRAGHSVVEAVRERNPKPTPILVVCGSGNNGGDGWVVAYELAEQGYPVAVVTPKLPGLLEVEPARETAMDVFANVQKKELPLRVVVAPRAEIFAQELEKAEIIIDALLGTGFTGKEVKEPYDAWIKEMNRHHKRNKKSYLISIDVPSGYLAQTGEHSVPCIVADLTVTMLAYKPGLLGVNAERFCGPIKLARLVEIEQYLPDVQPVE